MARASGAAAKRPYFTSDLFSFLADLRKHNERDWLERNRLRYEAAVRDPVLRFIADIGPRLSTISQHSVADKRPVRGSMMRIYRDIRFSADRTPYKAAITPRYGAAGVKKMAFHVPGDFPNTMETGGTEKVERAAVFSTAWFSQRQYAIEWLKKA